MATKEILTSYDKKKTTGQLLLIVGSHPTYEDGDILVAQNRKLIRAVHAEQLCHPKIKDRKVGGMLYNNYPLLRLLYQQGYQYQFERVSAKEVKRTNIWTGDAEIFSDKPNERGEAINIEAYLQRIKTAKKQPLFGDDGAEVWYGGRTHLDHAKLDTVWAEIEKRLNVLESDYADWPFTPTEKKKFLSLVVDDFDDTTRADIVGPLIDNSNPGNPITIKKRKNKIDWRMHLDIMEKDAVDSSKECDLTNEKYYRSEVVVTKTLESTRIK